MGEEAFTGNTERVCYRTEGKPTFGKPTFGDLKERERSQLQSTLSTVRFRLFPAQSPAGPV